MANLVQRWREWRDRNRDAGDWPARRGRFAGLDPDTDDRPQVMPVPEPPAEQQTHRPGHGRHGD